MEDKGEIINIEMNSSNVIKETEQEEKQILQDSTEDYLELLN